MGNVDRLPAAVVAEDRRLDAAAVRSQEDLARHRWHWTLDETNADRVSIKAYTRAVGLSDTAPISRMANGYAAWMAAKDGGMRNCASLGEHIRRAGMSAEREAATEAVAKATGRSFITASATNANEVAEVTRAARERAEARGTRVEDEVEHVAEWRARGRASRDAQQARAAATSSLQWVEVRAALAAARRHLRVALDESDGVEWTSEEADLLRRSIDCTRATLDLVELRVTGAAGIDWDAELAKLSDDAEADR